MHDITPLLEVISSISSSLAPDEALAEFTQKTAQIVGVDSCAISRWDRANKTVIVLADHVSAGVASPFDLVQDLGAAYPLADYPATAQVLKRQAPLVVYVDDPAADEAEKDLLRAFQWEGVLLVPMLYKEHAIGLMELYLAESHRHQFTAEDMALCQILANQAAIAIENARLYQEAEERRFQAEAMQVISRALASELDYQRIVRSVADFTYRLAGARFVCVAVPEEERIRPVAMSGPDSADAAVVDLVEALLSLLSREPLDRAIRGPILVPDIQSDPIFGPWQAAAEIRGWRTMIALPLISRNQIEAILIGFAAQPDYFEADDVAILMSLASQAAVAIQNARLFGELEAQSETLRQVSRRLVGAQEEERRRISRELHDELGQALTALKINLDVARRSLPDSALPKLHHSVSEASSLVVRTLETARSLSLELHPRMLDDLGLVSALRWEIDRYEKRTGQSVHFEANLAQAALPSELEITLYRIIVEALTNVARHAAAQHVSVYLAVRNRQVEACIQDDGLGFDAAGWFNSPAGRQSLGLTGMRERAELLGGRLQVTSRPGHGTTVRTQLPFAKSGHPHPLIEERA